MSQPLTLGRLLELILRGPERLRSREFRAEVTTYRGTAQTWPISEDPGPLHASEPELFAAGPSGWRYEPVPPGSGRLARLGNGAGGWWELDRPGVQEHLDPGPLLSSLYDLRAVDTKSGPVLSGRVRPVRDMDDLAALVYGFGGDSWAGVVDPRTGVLREARWLRSGRAGFRSRMRLELVGRPLPQLRSRPEWQAVLERMANAAGELERARFRATVRVSYSVAGVRALPDYPHPASSFSGGYEWRGWRRRLFPVGVRGVAREWASLEDHRRRLPPLLGQPRGAGFDAEFRLLARRGEWQAVALPVRSELDPYGWARTGERGPHWLRDELLVWMDPALREMLDPLLVLAALRLRRVRTEGAGWWISGVPRPSDRAHGYGASVVHPFGDSWEGMVDAATGVLVSCRTWAGRVELSSHRLDLCPI
ncbi:MAG: hypothetical protein ACP5PW_02380 [Candidatus Dormibacteria bacterium]